MGGRRRPTISTICLIASFWGVLYAAACSVFYRYIDRTIKATSVSCPKSTVHIPTLFVSSCFLKSRRTYSNKKAFFRSSCVCVIHRCICWFTSSLRGGLCTHNATYECCASVSNFYGRKIKSQLNLMLVAYYKFILLGIVKMFAE